MGRWTSRGDREPGRRSLPQTESTARISRGGPLAPDGARISRGGLLARGAAGLVAVGIGGAAARGLATASGSASPATALDQRVLRFALDLEELQVAFYTQALAAGHLTGEAQQFAQVVAAEERAHLEYLQRALGTGAGSAVRYRFGDALSDQSRFLATAAEIEDAGLAAYNGQATSLSSGALAEVSKVISVEARHAAWARSLAGQQPAPAAVDPATDAAQARAALARFGA